ncbi:hypothetical protein QWJ34_11295 [Saccharibacillus sp. CPCC 101409]|uniref:hypothetical protein n=1 Tax=Saccharibacillus sp. CPCC 101409 TaxID=3058041 RepID=UPI002671230F|nr:hypothetical protein [Saccharibacillus sp. CPCC 101409]MDO3410348.1 hypothetical protein [Saccharibacillus sp. CPCC 101409]
MEFSGKTRLAVLVIGGLLLLGIPLTNEIGYVGIYYAGVAAFLIWCGYRLTAGGRSEERFYRRWARIADGSAPWLVLGEAFRSFIWLNVLLSFGQLVVNGTSLRELAERFSPSAQILLIAVLVVFSLLLGFVSWREKSRKFERLRAQYER